MTTQADSPGADLAKIVMRMPYASARKRVLVSDCQDNLTPFSEYNGGLVVNHYYWCYVTPVEFVHEICSFNVGPVCLWTETGFVRAKLTIMGYGWDTTMATAADPPDLNQISFVGTFSDWTAPVGDIMAQRFTFSFSCADFFTNAPCTIHPGEGTHSGPLAEWVQGSFYFRAFSDPRAGLGNDKISAATTRFSISGNVLPVQYEGPNFRCDAATYDRGTGGCVFQEVVDIFPIGLGNANHPQAAEHIWTAQFFPELTVPDPVAGQRKAMPGNPLSPYDSGPVTRLYEYYDTDSGAIVTANRRTARNACVRYFGPDYAANGDECDEYPMASTFQGASRAGGNFSVQAIPGSDNGSAGGLLSGFYTANRILHTDPFYVIPVPGDDDSDLVGNGAPYPDYVRKRLLPPQVSAGPDLAVDEGHGAVLRGWVSSRTDAAASARWSYEPVSDVDAGAACSFADAGSAVTRFTCTDDGTFQVTLTASDSTGTASDSALIHVRNVAPRLTLKGPAPWSVHRAGEAVPVTATFTDPGSNDTHTCRIAWDDGTTQDTPATDGSCDRTHTFGVPGMYTVGVTVTDDDGGSDTASTMVIVVDPDAGWANIDGSTDSPPGSLVGGSDGDGEVWGHLFGHYYQPDELTGTFASWLPGTDFRIEATRMDWLAVAPDGKVAAKGIGEIAGSNTYGWVMYGYQGCTPWRTTDCQPGPDKVRILVWPLSDGPYPRQVLTYDSAADVDYDLDNAQPLPMRSGQVLIQRP